MTSQFLYREGNYTSGAASPSQEHIKIPPGRLSSSSASSSAASLSSSPRYAMDRGQQESTTVEIMRCSRCAKTVEVIGRRSSDGTARVSSSDASASGMVRFGHNLYYCDRCARLVGYNLTLRPDISRYTKETLPSLSPSLPNQSPVLESIVGEDHLTCRLWSLWKALPQNHPISNIFDLIIKCRIFGSRMWPQSACKKTACLHLETPGVCMIALLTRFCRTKPYAIEDCTSNLRTLSLKNLLFGLADGRNPALAHPVCAPRQRRLMGYTTPS